ncbi:hypothetical protein [Burkholderia cepacia]|uniref:hypothetical protein n=1 Tax=Burkholderia cepacia TaxID=292 RepID=UPI000B2E0701|nr:hypothetical protein [Burkholderia cepacia]
MTHDQHGTIDQNARASLASGFLSGIERKRDIELNLANGRADQIQTFMKKRRIGR